MKTNTYSNTVQEKEHKAGSSVSLAYDLVPGQRFHFVDTCYQAMGPECEYLGKLQFRFGSTVRTTFAPTFVKIKGLHY